MKNRETVREWIKTRERNEALDHEIYCLDALFILGPAFVKALPQRGGPGTEHSSCEGEAQEAGDRAQAWL